LRKLLLSFLTVLLFSSLAYAETTKDLTIIADTMSYSEDGTTIDAYGTVEAYSRDMSLEAASISYNVKTRDLYTMRMKGGMVIKGERIKYNTLKKKGITQKVRINYRSSVIEGDIAFLEEDRVELRGASFNTCGLEPPHYHVSSTTTTLYPEDGWVIGYWGFLWVSSVPTLPVPVYMYDLKSQGLGRRSEIKDVLSMPEVGSNDEDGYYMSYKVPWIYNRNLSGKVKPFYTEKGGVGGGVDGLYSINESNDLNFRVSYDPRYNTFGGLTHRYYFGNSEGSKEATIYNFLKITERPIYEFDTAVTYRERVNYQRVSMLPNFTLRMNDVRFLADNIHVNGQLSYGHITESTEETAANGSEVGKMPLTESDVGNFQANGIYGIPTEYGQLDLGLGYHQSWYSFKSYWSRLANTTRLSRQLYTDLDGYIRHLHYINYTGNSIFRYEMYREVPSDEMGIGLGYNFGIHRVTVDYSYYVPSWDPQDLDYGVAVGFHCYEVDIKYRAARKEIVIGVSLVTR
jgi:hypothetical protein